ncbi:unnamed protein product [Amoebophrya sp. A25]|nr:unnamed protein product [Amoebophrya sp. A25]|eukprot:GSA25T00022342001.1
MEGPGSAFRCMPSNVSRNTSRKSESVGAELNGTSHQSETVNSWPAMSCVELISLGNTKTNCWAHASVSCESAVLDAFGRDKFTIARGVSAAKAVRMPRYPAATFVHGMIGDRRIDLEQARDGGSEQERQDFYGDLWEEYGREWVEEEDSGTSAEARGDGEAGGAIGGGDDGEALDEDTTDEADVVNEVQHVGKGNGVLSSEQTTTASSGGDQHGKNYIQLSNVRLGEASTSQRRETATAIPFGAYLPRWSYVKGRTHHHIHCSGRKHGRKGEVIRSSLDLVRPLTGAPPGTRGFPEFAHSDHTVSFHGFKNLTHLWHVHVEVLGRKGRKRTTEVFKEDS